MFENETLRDENLNKSTPKKNCGINKTYTFVHTRIPVCVCQHLSIQEFLLAFKAFCLCSDTLRGFGTRNRGRVSSDESNVKGDDMIVKWKNDVDF